MQSGLSSERVHHHQSALLYSLSLTFLKVCQYAQNHDSQLNLVKVLKGSSRIATMNPTKEERHRSNAKTYWLCQCVGWFAFAVIEFLFEMSSHPISGPRSRVAIAWGLCAFEGLIGTHFLYLFVKWRQWFQKTGSKLLLRLACVIPLLAVVLDAMDWLFTRFTISSPLIFLTIGNWMIVLTAWTAIYLAIHEFRQRRLRELQGLRMEVVAHEAQLRGLRAQLNPHFLFNCLNSLRELISEDQERAQLMVERLCAMLRYSLQMNQDELVLLSEEISAVQDYLALEAIRFEERLRVRWNISPEARSVKVPPMLLQTLVENALKHGIARRPEGGEIVISGVTHGEGLRLEVGNSGKLSSSELSAGVGLRNARERLNLMYGEGARISLDELSEGWVMAVVTLPPLSLEIP
jgi:sensor histidine kinase YesM